MSLYSGIRDYMKISALSIGIGLVSLVGLSGCISRGSFLYENARFNKEYDAARRKIEEARTPEEKQEAKEEFNRVIHEEMKKWKGFDDLGIEMRF